MLNYLAINAILYNLVASTFDTSCITTAKQRESLKMKKMLRVTARLQNVDNDQPVTQSSKIDNAFASSAHFSSSVNGARAIQYGFLAKYSPDLHVMITHLLSDFAFLVH